MGLRQANKFLHWKGNYQQSEKTTQLGKVLQLTQVEGLRSRMHKELQKLNKNQANQLSSENRTRTVFKGEMQRADT